MKNRYLIITLLASLILAACHKEDDLHKEPKVTEKSLEVLATQATFSWTVDYPGKICSMVEVSLREDMGEATRYGSDAETLEKKFSATATGLTEATTYYYRYVVWNPMADYKLEVKSFTTYAKPTVTTTEITDIDWRTATGGGEVTDDGDATVTERGICWSTGHNPEITDAHADNGTGIGSYTVDMTGLAAGTTYYARAYAKNQAGVGYGDEVNFKTKDPELSTVTTGDVTDISWTSAKCSGNVTSDGGVEVMERGICWSTSPNPEITDSHANNGTGTGSCIVSMTGLTAGTTYYVRAYSRNSVGVSYGEEKQFETPALQKPTVTTTQVTSITSASAVGGGEVTSDGGTAVFERGVCWSTSHNPEITDSHANNGMGTGSYTVNMTGLTEDATYYVRAYAVNSEGTSYGAEVSFVPLPEGAVGSLFSVSASNQVYFSQGNLQYRASDGKWRFAEQQYDCIGSANSDISSSYSGWIDLFGWGTSGWNSGANCYQPWSTSTSDSNYYPGGSYTNSLTGSYAKADWGVYNKILNGGNQAGMWRTLTKDEWAYVFDTRGTASGIRYAKACVNSQNGVILLPDDWRSSYYSLSSTNNTSAGFTDNTISASQWSILEQHGAVFLPAAGYRNGTSVYYVDSCGCYWSVSYYSSYSAYYVYFGDSNLYLGSDDRGRGLSVRLVHSAQ